MAHNLTVDELLALLRDDSLKNESIAEEMECAGAGRPQPDQVQAARDALKGAENGVIAAIGRGRAGIDPVPGSATRPSPPDDQSQP